MAPLLKDQVGVPLQSQIQTLQKINILLSQEWLFTKLNVKNYQLSVAKYLPMRSGLQL